MLIVVTVSYSEWKMLTVMSPDKYVEECISKLASINECTSFLCLILIYGQFFGFQLNRGKHNSVLLKLYVRICTYINLQRLSFSISQLYIHS